MKLNFRVATLDDSLKINELVNSAYRGDSSKMGWTTEADLLGGQRSDLAEIEEIILDKNQAIILCIQEQQIIGTVVVQQKSACAYIGMLTVKPDLQKSGVGKLLLAAAEDHITNVWHQDEIEMTVIKQRTELINWYGRRGYFPSGESRPFPYGDLSFGIPKVNDLEFIVLKKTKSNEAKMLCKP